MTHLDQAETCHLCGAPLPGPKFYARDLLADSAATYPVIQCGTCGLIRTSQSELQDPSRHYLAGYHRQIADQRGPQPPATAGAFAGRLRSLQRFKTAGRILDVGCGDGSFLVALREAGWEVWGTEVLASAVEAARGQGLDIREGKLPDLRFPAGHFDFITYFGAFEHVERPLEELAEVKRILKPDGCLLLNLTNAGSLEARLFGPSWFGLEVPRHRFNYPPSTLRRLLARADLICLRADFQHIDFITSFSLAWWLGLGAHYAALRRPLAGLVKVARRLALLGRGNVLEVVASRPRP